MDRPTQLAALATVLSRTVVASVDVQGASTHRIVYRFVLRVRRPDGVLATISIEEAFWLLELKPRAGDRDVGVRLEGERARLDLRGDPRYDVDALLGERAARRRGLGTSAGAP